MEHADGLKYFEVHDNHKRTRTVLAKDGASAIDAWYESINSCIGHIIGTCGCFGPVRPLDWSKFKSRPLKVIDCETGQVVRTLLYPNLEGQGWP